MLASELAVIRCLAAGEQKHRHVDAEGLLEQGHHAVSAAETAGLDRTPEALVWVIGEGGKQPVEAVLLQGLGGCHAADLIKAERQAVCADAKREGNLGYGDGLLEVQPEILLANATTCMGLWLQGRSGPAPCRAPIVCMACISSALPGSLKMRFPFLNVVHSMGDLPGAFGETAYSDKASDCSKLVDLKRYRICKAMVIQKIAGGMVTLLAD